MQISPKCLGLARRQRERNNMKALTPAQQRKAISILKKQVENSDEQSPNETGFDDHDDTLEIRLLLIECGAMPDRRQAKKK